MHVYFLSISHLLDNVPPRFLRLNGRDLGGLGHDSQAAITVAEHPHVAPAAYQDSVSEVLDLFHVGCRT